PAYEWEAPDEGALGGRNEKDRGYRKAFQARRSQRSAAGSWPAGHHRNRSEGFWPPEGPYRALSWRRIRRRFPSQGESRGGVPRRSRREGNRSDPQRRAD